mmetsp:Transcript_8664/g.36114  ORF Transcript_8664/g.36114 Transcript_8664/m.36114 type:complete len:307 (-) Transcript_8664:321-1241(-)
MTSPRGLPKYLAGAASTTTVAGAPGTAGPSALLSLLKSCFTSALICFLLVLSDLLFSLPRVDLLGRVVLDVGLAVAGLGVPNALSLATPVSSVVGITAKDVERRRAGLAEDLLEDRHLLLALLLLPPAWCVMLILERIILLAGVPKTVAMFVELGALFRSSLPVLLTCEKMPDSEVDLFLARLLAGLAMAISFSFCACSSSRCSRLLFLLRRDIGWRLPPSSSSFSTGAGAGTGTATGTGFERVLRLPEEDVFRLESTFDLAEREGAAMVTLLLPRLSLLEIDFILLDFFAFFSTTLVESSFSVAG